MILDQYRLQALVTIIGLVLIFLVWQLIKHNKLRPVYGILWLIASGLFLVAVLVPGLITGLARFLRVDYVPSLIFGLGLLFVICLLLSQTVVISNLTKKNIDLAQRFSILNWQLEQLTKRLEQLTDQSEKDENIIIQTSYLSGSTSGKKVMPLGPEANLVESTNSEFPLDDGTYISEETDKVVPFNKDSLTSIQEDLLQVGDEQE